MRYTLDQLMTFELVSKLNSFSAVARMLKRAPSAVSMAMSNLEIEMDVTLFERTPRQVLLTDAGESLLNYARVVLESCHVMEQRASAFSEGIEREISLAIEIPWGMIAPVLYEFAMAFPLVDIHVREPFHGDVEAMVRKGDVDLGIALARPLDAETVQFMQLGKVVMVNVASSKHPLAGKIPVSFADLHHYRQIAFGFAEHPIATTEYLSSASAWRMESYNTMLDAVQAGLGWASIPRECIATELEAGSLVELRQQEYPHTDWLVGVDLLWAKKGTQGVALKWLRERLIQHKIFERDAAGNMTTL